VTDGDDHVWTGDRKTLEGGKWRVIQERSVLGKRLREDINANDTEPHMREIEGTTSGSEYDTLSEEISYNSDHSDEDEVSRYLLQSVWIVSNLLPHFFPDERSRV
jgi:hypothetical protein